MPIISFFNFISHITLFGCIIVFMLIIYFSVRGVAFISIEQIDLIVFCKGFALRIWNYEILQG